ncbi:MAG TPA: DUF3817 domain-containing protein [Membranihabitans sp.]|nr:DUF3817 domain-containing protein [Membranihabitans sp.]
MSKFFTSKIGRLRLYAFLEGLSLLALVFIAMPLKYFQDNPAWVQFLGPLHGGLFVLFVVKTIWIAIQKGWPWIWRTSVVLASSFIPFGTFFVDHRILRHLH